jgi:glycosyltransferase involved in cell wall biosynthesis
LPTLYVLLKVCENQHVKISAVIIAFNEEKKIADAIKSVAWADEILVVDSESTDETRKIAESLGAKVSIKKWLGFSAQKQFAVDNASFDWIFSLDADEKVSDELKTEILKLKNDSAEIDADGFRIPRLSFYMNRPIQHGGWYPDWQLRLFNRRKGRWKDVLIHESFVLENGAKIEKLSGDVLHYSWESAAHHERMISERYAPLAAEQNFQNGKRTSPLKIVFAGFLAFFQTYFVKAGFLDGFAGFCIARFAAHHAFLKHMLLWEKQTKVKSEK